MSSAINTGTQRGRKADHEVDAGASPPHPDLSPKQRDQICTLSAGRGVCQSLQAAQRMLPSDSPLPAQPGLKQVEQASGRGRVRGRHMPSPSASLNASPISAASIFPPP